MRERPLRRAPLPALDPGEEPGEGPPRDAHHRRARIGEPLGRRGARKDAAPGAPHPAPLGRNSAGSLRNGVSSRLLGRERKRSREAGHKGGPRPMRGACRPAAVSCTVTRAAVLQFRHKSPPERGNP
ncbi:hypothetical protein MRX96_019501 [Rhipicephalus microplus]